MGARRLTGIAEQLLAGGMAIDTPVAVISHASWSDQRIECSTLTRILGADQAEIASPALAIIGEVARIPTLARELAAAAGGV